MLDLYQMPTCWRGNIKAAVQVLSLGAASSSLVVVGRSRNKSSNCWKAVQSLESNGGHLAFDDDSTPDAIREAFHCSKKAFKQALGALYKSRRIQFKKPGIQLLDNTT
jgi:hypothetical protein